MPVMVTEVTSIEEQLASMKATLERLAKESLEKDAQIKHQSEQIANMMKNMEKQLSEFSNKALDGEESNKELNYSEDSNNERIPRKESSLGVMFIEQIQSLFVNAMKAQLEA